MIELDFDKDEEGMAVALFISHGVLIGRIWDKPTAYAQLDEFYDEGIIVARTHSRMTSQIRRSGLTHIIWRKSESPDVG